MLLNVPNVRGWLGENDKEFKIGRADRALDVMWHLGRFVKDTIHEVGAQKEVGSRNVLIVD